MTKKCLVSIVIINFNSGKYIFDCLNALKVQTYNAIEIIVVDNSSSDGSTTLLENYQSKLPFRFYFLEKNMGSSYANNFGINESHGEYLLILNADVFLEKRFIEKCVSVFTDHSSVGAVVGKLVSDRDNSILDTVGIKIYKEGFGVDLGYGERDVGQYGEECFIDGACCAAAVYKREMLDDIGYGLEYFDEDYFAFYEDLDLSYRASLMGWKTRYTPDAKGKHVRGGSTQTMSNFVRYLTSRNIIFFLIKTYKPQTISARFYSFVYLIIKFAFIDKFKLVLDYYRLRNNFKRKTIILNKKIKNNQHYYESYIKERAKKLLK